MTQAAYAIQTVVSVPFEQNAYLVWLRGRDEVIVVDPGFDVDALVRILDERGLRPVALVNTHGHADHIAGNRPMKERFPEAPLIIGRREASMLSDPDANLSAPFGLPLTSPAPDRLLDEGDRLELAGIEFLVREIPGHSPGSIVLIADRSDPPFVLAGDVLFAGSVGRVDFPGGDGRSLLEGIRTKLFCLPDGTLVFPGHGPPTTIGQERRDNPFVGDAAGPAALG